VTAQPWIGGLFKAVHKALAGGKAHPNVVRDRLFKGYLIISTLDISLLFINSTRSKAKVRPQWQCHLIYRRNLPPTANRIRSSLLMN
jgi:hypothetical protein